MVVEMALRRLALQAAEKPEVPAALAKQALGRAVRPRAMAKPATTTSRAKAVKAVKVVKLVRPARQVAVALAAAPRVVAVRRVA